MRMTEWIADLERQIKVIEESRLGRQGESHHTKIIGAKLVLKGADKFREKLGSARSELERYNDSLQIAIQNMEQFEKSMKEFEKINTDMKMVDRALEVQRVISANSRCGNRLERKEINRRTAVALMDFVEKVSSGKSSTGKNWTARDEEIAVLPAVAKVLLEVSKYLP